LTDAGNANPRESHFAAAQPNQMKWMAETKTDTSGFAQEHLCRPDLYASGAAERHAVMPKHEERWIAQQRAIKNRTSSAEKYSE